MALEGNDITQVHLCHSFAICAGRVWPSLLPAPPELLQWFHELLWWLCLFSLLSLVSLPGRKVSSLVQLGCEYSPPVAIHRALMSLVMATRTQPAMLLVQLPVSASSEPFPAAAGGPYQLRGSSTVPGGRAASTGTLPTGLWGETGWWGITGGPMVLGDHSSAVGWPGILASWGAPGQPARAGGAWRRNEAQHKHLTFPLAEPPAFCQPLVAGGSAGSSCTCDAVFNSHRWPCSAETYQCVLWTCFHFWLSQDCREGISVCWLLCSFVVTQTWANTKLLLFFFNL